MRTSVADRLIGEALRREADRLPLREPTSEELARALSPRSGAGCRGSGAETLARGRKARRPVRAAALVPAGACALLLASATLALASSGGPLSAKSLSALLQASLPEEPETVVLAILEAAAQGWRARGVNE